MVERDTLFLYLYKLIFLSIRSPNYNLSPGSPLIANNLPLSNSWILSSTSYNIINEKTLIIQIIKSIFSVYMGANYSKKNNKKIKICYSKEILSILLFYFYGSGEL